MQAISAAKSELPEVLAVGAIYRDRIVRDQEEVCSIGGVSTNLVRHLAQAGIAVELLVMLEPGPLGEQALEACRGLPIKVVATRVSGSMGEFHVALDSGGQTRIIAVRHPDGSLPAIHLDLLRGRVRCADFLLIELGVPRELVDAALDLGRRCGGSRVGLPTRVETVGDWPVILRQLDLLILNSAEAAAILGTREPIDFAQASVASERLLSYGLKSVVLSCGARGAVVAASGEPTQWIPAPEVDVVSTLGAGDALAAGTVIGLARGLSAAAAVSQAMPRVRRVLQSVEAFPTPSKTRHAHE